MHEWMPGSNPYVAHEARTAIHNIRLGNAATAVGITFDHPNHYYMHWVLEMFPDDTTRNTLGYIAPPVNLWMWAPLAWLPFVSAAKVFWAFSVGVYGAVAALFTSLMTGGPALRRAGAILLVWSVMALDDNIRLSLLIGQMDAVFFAPLALMVYLGAFYFDKRTHPRIVRALETAVRRISRKSAWIFGSRAARLPDWIAEGHLTRWIMGAALGFSIVKVYPAVCITFALALAAADKAYNAANAPFSKNWIGRLNALRPSRNPLTEVVLASVATILFMGGMTLALVEYEYIVAWFHKLNKVFEIKVPAPGLVPDLLDYVRYWGRFWGVDSPLMFYGVTILVAFPLLWLSARMVTRAVDLQDPILRLVAFSMLVALLPTVTARHSRYSNVIMWIPLLAGLCAFKFSWKEVRIPAVLLPVGFLLLNYDLRQRLLSLVSTDGGNWWFQHKRVALSERYYRMTGGELTHAYFFSLENLLGYYPGTLVIVAALGLLYASHLKRVGRTSSNRKAVGKLPPAKDGVLPKHHKTRPAR